MSNSKDNSRNSSGGRNNNQNQISKDQFGNELSRISMKAEADQYSSLDSQDKNDFETCTQTNTSVMKTEISHMEHDEKEEFKELREDKEGENRLT